MPTYLHPGVYIEEIPSGVRPIEGVGTSTAVFIGYATKGPLEIPELITGFDDYQTEYGGIRDLGTGAVGDAMGFSVQRFFQNGGTKTYIVRLAKDDSDNQKPLAKAAGKLNHPDATNTTEGLQITAVNEGSWADGLIVKLTAKTNDPTLYTVEVGREDSRCNFVATESYFNVSLDDTHARHIESVVNEGSPTVDIQVTTLASITDPTGYRLGTSISDDLSTANLNFIGKTETERELEIALDRQASFTVTVPASDFTGNLEALATFIQAEVRKGGTTPRQGFTCDAKCGKLVLTSGTRTNASSTEVTAANAATDLTLGGNESTGAENLTARLASGQAELVGGGDGVEVDNNAYDAVFTALEKVRDISIVCLPGTSWDTDGRPVIEKAIAHAEKTKSRMVIIDPPAGTELESESDVVALGLPTSTYSVLYYPWAKVANPFYDEEDNPGVPSQLLVQPSGYAAGMWSKIDARRGVWKAPAGLEAALLGVAGLEYIVEDAEQDALNPLGVNALRSVPGFSNKVIWGSRTLSTRADPEWRYVPVRRTAIMLEQSIYNGIQWAVFEPNDHRLWGSLRLNIESFMNGLFRAGAFQGEKVTDAYYVRCGLGDTMTQGDIDRGQVIVIVGFAPLKPAEFVIVRIQQKVGQE